MSVFKYHAFIYFMRPPPWYGTPLILKVQKIIFFRMGQNISWGISWDFPRGPRPFLPQNCPSLYSGQVRGQKGLNSLLKSLEMPHYTIRPRFQNQQYSTLIVIMFLQYHMISGPRPAKQQNRESTYFWLKRVILYHPLSSTLNIYWRRLPSPLLRSAL
jgi:hypothetical protein